MKFRKAGIEGAWLIELEPRVDERGLFGRTFCADEFATHGLETRIVQANLSVSRRAGTLRGIHFQLEPAAEVKLVRVQHGAIWDVIVDMRNDSRTFSTWYGVELTAENALALYVPRGFGHSFLTLTDDTAVSYSVSAPYTPHLERGVRWNDPDIKIRWPLHPTVLSEKDSSLPFLKKLKC